MSLLARLPGHLLLFVGVLLVGGVTALALATGRAPGAVAAAVAAYGLFSSVVGALAVTRPGSADDAA